MTICSKLPVLSVFTTRKLINEEEKSNNNHVSLYELPNDKIKKISMSLLDRCDKVLNKSLVIAKAKNY